MFKLTGWIILTLLSSYMMHVSTQKSIKKCDNNGCETPSTIIGPESQRITIEMTRTRLAMRAAPKKTKIIYVKRNWLTIYCYQGGNTDANTGCYESLTQMTPTCEESREWINKGMCRTGKECAPDGDCWGKDADVCTWYSPPMVNEIGPKELKWAGERWMIFPYHSCVSSWECLIFEAEVDVFVEIDEGKEIFYYMDKDNKRHIYDNGLYVEGDKDKGGNRQCIKDTVERYTSEDLEATCFGESKDKIKCILISGDEWDGVVIDMQEAEIAVLRNAIFHLKGPLYVPDGNGKIINVGKTDHHNSYKEGIKHVYELTRAASIEDVLELSYSLAGAQMQAVFNLLKMSERVVSLEKTTISVIESLSLLDPGLLHRITGGTPYSVRWQTPKVFETCPCYDVGEFFNSNCNGEYMFKDGAYMEKNDTSLCKFYHSEEIRNVSIFKNFKVETTPITVLPPQTASSDSSEWDTLSDWRNDKSNGEHTSHSYKNLEDRMVELSNVIGLESITKWFWFATAAVAWIAGLITIGPLICRGRG